MAKVLVTSALPYANGRAHLGHMAGAYLPADIYVRWRRLRGDDVVFICGSDSHGVPITLNAVERGCTPKEVVDENHAANGAAFEQANIIFDYWGRTDCPQHAALTQEFFRALADGGYIDDGEIEQYYSEVSEMFLPDRYVEGTCPRCGSDSARGDQCDNCGSTYEVTDLIDPRSALPGDNSTPVLKPTLHWFLRLDKLQGAMEEYIDSRSGWRPAVVGTARGWLKMKSPDGAVGLRPRCITRDTEWGVEIPIEGDQVVGKRLYVWFDAPIGYVTFTQQLFAQRGDPDGWRDYWLNPDCEIYNFIGKDNTPFHAVTFPAMQWGVNQSQPSDTQYQLATEVVASEYLNFGGEKGSKSKGNAVQIGDFVARFGAEPLRYYITSILPEENDSSFTWDEFAHRYNGELADVLGNFVHRAMTFAHKYYDGKVPDGSAAGEAEAAQRSDIDRCLRESHESLDGFKLRVALSRVLDLARAGNRFFDDKAPWKQRKEDAAGCATTIQICLETVAALGLGLRPFLPESATKILGWFGVSTDDAMASGSHDTRPATIASVGRELAKQEVLFPKIEAEDLPQ
ncbi:MAG: methionine--tRNA ligase [Planctomycetota bacterium]